MNSQTCGLMSSGHLATTTVSRCATVATLFSSSHLASLQYRTDSQSNREGHMTVFLSVSRVADPYVPVPIHYTWIQIQYLKKFWIRIRLQKLKIPHYTKE
jgi:hypothetical protein